MKQTPLTSFVERFGQTGAANRLGVTQAAIRKALLAERTIFVFENEDGSFSANEIKPFPSPGTSTLKVTPSGAVIHE